MDTLLDTTPWSLHLHGECSKKYFQELCAFLAEEKKTTTVYPPEDLIFSALRSCPLELVKVVILGQDPYIREGQANGLAFSVSKQTSIPPSLRNIFREVESDLRADGLTFGHPTHGDLDSWAKQGVLLLNTSLTVRYLFVQHCMHQNFNHNFRKGIPDSHSGKGWEIFTDAIVKLVNERRKNVVFMLWGKNAQQKSSLIDSERHHILKAAHPSPYSARSGFFGCRHFTKANRLVAEAGEEPIDWRLGRESTSRSTTTNSFGSSIRQIKTEATQQDATPKTHDPQMFAGLVFVVSGLVSDMRRIHSDVKQGGGTTTHIISNKVETLAYHLPPPCSPHCYIFLDNTSHHNERGSGLGLLQSQESSRIWYAYCFVGLFIRVRQGGKAIG